MQITTTLWNVADNNSSSSSRLTYKDNNNNNNMVNALSPLRKFFGSTSKRERRHSSSESICEKESPRGVLEGPEAASTPADDCSSSSSSIIGRRSHTNNWRRLSVARLFFPLPPSPEDSISMEGDACSSYAEEVKPSWRCFSYEEISRATDKFHPGKEDEYVLV